MKKISVIIVFAFFALTVKGQSNVERFSNKIAQKIKDSLQLSEKQKAQLYEINMKLTQQKADLRKEYKEDSLRIKMQAIENTRDVLYKDVLPPDKYAIYILKKRSLINNN
jgi:hypothetical protein